LTELFEYVETFRHRKSQVKDLLLSRAHAHSVIKYSEMYGLFEPDRTACSGDSIWKGCIWNTVEEVSGELSSGDGAIYFSMLSNKDGVPQDVFWMSFLRRRRNAYEHSTQLLLPQTEGELTLSQKVAIARFERELVYRHARKYYMKFGQQWERMC